MFRCFFCFKQKTAYEVRISDWSSDVCSSDLVLDNARQPLGALAEHALGGADQIVALVGLIRLRGRGRRGGIAGLLVGGGGRRRLLRIDVGVGIAGAVRGCLGARIDLGIGIRSEEHTSELQSLMRTSSAVFSL